MIKTEDVISRIRKVIPKILEDHSVTGWTELETIGDRTYAIVAGFQDGFEDCDLDTPYADGTQRLCMKLAYVPTNSLMHEYDMDWIMPEVPGSKFDVWDTETSIAEDDIEPTIKWLMSQWTELKKNLN